MDTTDLKPIKNILTSKEAETLGIPFRFPPPAPQRCRYCGETVYPEGIFFMGSIVVWNPSPPRCTCPKAAEYWKKFDIEEEKKAEEDKKDRERYAEDLKKKYLFDKSSLPKRFLSRTFDSYVISSQKQKIAFDAAVSYADDYTRHEDSGTGLYICGSYGTGKTHLAAAITIALLNEGVSVIFRTAADILNDIRRTFNSGYDGTESAEILDIYKSCGLLVIDDLGKEKPTMWTVTQFFAIINDRYENMKPTIITSNFELEKLSDAITPENGNDSAARSIVSRLRETSEIIDMTWGDYRKKSYNIPQPC